MSGLVQDDIGLGRAVERPTVPIEGPLDPISMDRDAQAASQRKGCPPIPLGRRPDGAIRRGRADAAKRGARERVLQLGHEAVENLVELLSGNGGQDHQRYVGYDAGYAEGRSRAPSDELRILHGAGRSLASENRRRTAMFGTARKRAADEGRDYRR